MGREEKTGWLCGHSMRKGMFLGWVSGNAHEKGKEAKGRMKLSSFPLG